MTFDKHPCKSRNRTRVCAPLFTIFNLCFVLPSSLLTVLLNLSLSIPSLVLSQFRPYDE
ncbi:hypothetical protein Scep_003259 [Stephania cephalantha]|uniref:Transmembrane protein n=1 Tax=Stephania cephalantha TaxID=152367 RepID=A0AAP0PVN1_9MAGN